MVGENVYAVRGLESFRAMVGCSPGTPSLTKSDDKKSALSFGERDLLARLFK